MQGASRFHWKLGVIGTNCNEKDRIWQIWQISSRNAALLIVEVNSLSAVLAAVRKWGENAGLKMQMDSSDMGAERAA
jgi:hypothetical protein